MRANVSTRITVEVMLRDGPQSLRCDSPLPRQAYDTYDISERTGVCDAGGFFVFFLSFVVRSPLRALRGFAASR